MRALSYKIRAKIFCYIYIFIWFPLPGHKSTCNHPMSGSVALRKLRKEYASLRTEPPTEGIEVRPLETNFLHAHFLFHGKIFYDTCYEGGVYHGVLQFSKNYPFSPPSIILRTPSGRFVANERICFSMSDFHPELWQPSWSVRTILNGLASFWNSEEITTGGLRGTAAGRAELARRSLDECRTRDALAARIFEEELKEIRASRGAGGPWPPPRPIATERKRAGDGIGGAGVGKSDAPNIAPKITARDAKVVPNTAPPGSGKNAKKNAKRREKEKRKKAAARFLSDLRSEAPGFVRATVAALLERWALDVSAMTTDHLCHRTDSVEQYQTLVDALRGSADCELLTESNVGGRPIATFKLETPIDCSSGDGEERLVDIIEIPSPKEGRDYRAGLEHVEFVIPSQDGSKSMVSPESSDGQHHALLSGFMEAYPSVPWDTKAIQKKNNPDVSLKIALEQHGTIAVKFHLMALEEVIRHET